MTKVLLLCVMIALVLHSCAGGNDGPGVETDPLFESFFSKARLIMLNEEIGIYKHLPDLESKKQFIEDFWQKRDPDPVTEGNEFKKEFEARIAFANRWFREGRGVNRGWDTERGRILLILGFPSKREWGNFVSPEYFYQRLDGETPRAVERWVYEDLQMELVFVDMKGFGDFRMEMPPPGLGSAMEMVKASYLLEEVKSNMMRISFDASFKDNQLTIYIPVKKINFEKSGDTMKAKLRISITFYLDYLKKNRKVLDHEISEKEGKLLEKKNWEIVVPLDILEKGKYLFEVVVSDEKSGSSYLKYIHHTI